MYIFFHSLLNFFTSVPPLPPAARQILHRFGFRPKQATPANLHTFFCVPPRTPRFAGAELCRASPAGGATEGQPTHPTA